MIHVTKISILSLTMLFGFGSALHAATFNYFTAPPSTMPQGTIGFTYAGNKFVGTVLQNGVGSLYSTDLAGNNAQAFAPTVSLTSSTSEHFVAASFAAGGFIGGEIYAADGSNIVHITNNGASSNTFVSGLSGEVRGITFDLNGSFGNKMLVTTSFGNVYTVTSGGAATLLATVPQDVEGLDIAPASFGSFGGQLIVASEATGTLRAIKPSGIVQTLPFTVASCEELTFVPLSLAPGNNSLVGLYGANFMPDILKANGSDFLGMQGDLIVTGETTSQVSRVNWNGTNFVVSNIGSFPNQPEDGIFVTQEMVNLSTPEPSAFVLAGLGLVGLCALARRKRASALSQAFPAN